MHACEPSPLPGRSSINWGHNNGDDDDCCLAIKLSQLKLSE